MQTLSDLAALVERLARGVPELNLDGDEQEEYSTMLLWLQNQVEGGTAEPEDREGVPLVLCAIRISRCLNSRPNQGRW